MEDSNRLIAKIALPVSNLTLLDYAINDSCPEGSFIEMPFRKSSLIGILWTYQGQSEFKKLRVSLKYIEYLPPLSRNFMNFVEAAAAYNYSKLGNFIKMILPDQKFAAKDFSSSKPQFSLDHDGIVLSTQQEIAFQKIKESRDFKIFALDGVTGSGKTEVYLAVINDILQHDPLSQILILVPEILLTNQLIERFKKHFDCEIPYWHSDLKISHKKRLWQAIIKGEVKIVIGARSALFLPFKNLKMIVVDEEHDASYKQTQGVTYNARDMAILRGYYENFPLILASATLSVETEANIESGKYERITMESRYGNSSIPDIKIIDLTKSKLAYGKWIAKETMSAIKNCLDRDKQILLFLNRRGYAPLTICKSCGFRVMCPKCSVWLVQHRNSNKLICHHCGLEKSIVKDCPECNVADSFIPCGPGIERIEEEIREIFPNKKIAVLSTDTTKNSDESSMMIHDILDNKVNIIIGTQLISKGHHFPNLELVCVLDGDAGLNGSDMRATERCFQLLNQVCGRAGRESTSGKAIIQTYNPDNPIIRALVTQNRKDFITNELYFRKLNQMPPFSKLAGIILSGKSEILVHKLAKQLAQQAPIAKSLEVLGPVPALITKINDHYRYRLLIKADKNSNIGKYLDQWLNSIKIPYNISLKIDIDPHNFY